MPLTLQERHTLAATLGPAIYALGEAIERLTKAHHDKAAADLWGTDRWFEASEGGHAAIDADPEIAALRQASDLAERARRAIMNSDRAEPAA